MFTAAYAALVLSSVPANAKAGHPPTQADYARIATAKCAIAKPSALEPAQEAGEMRPIVLYFVANDNHSPKKFAFICMDSDVVPRTDVYIAYTAFNYRGVMPVFYGDNGPRCRVGSNEQALPECSSNRFVTGGTTATPVVAPVATTYEYKGYGAMATVFTSFVTPDHVAHPRYYRVPIETIPLGYPSVASQVSRHPHP